MPFNGPVLLIAAVLTGWDWNFHARTTVWAVRNVQVSHLKQQANRQLHVMGHSVCVSAHVRSYFNGSHPTGSNSVK